MDAADIALVDDKVGELPHLLSLSKKDDDYDQMESYFFNDPELCGHYPCNYGDIKSRCRCIGA